MFNCSPFRLIAPLPNNISRRKIYTFAILFKAILI